jgi:hypothetical protein
MELLRVKSAPDANGSPDAMARTRAHEGATAAHASVGAGSLTFFERATKPVVGGERRPVLAVSLAMYLCVLSTMA